jgi:hypothetical protein
VVSIMVLCLLRIAYGIHSLQLFFFTSERRDVQLVRARRIPRKNCCRKMENISLRLFKSTFECLFSVYENSALSIVTVIYLWIC